jgi:DNA adenine methylase
VTANGNPAKKLLESLESKGIQLYPIGGDLRVVSPEPLEDDERAQIKKYKPNLYKLLACAESGLGFGAPFPERAVVTYPLTQTPEYQFIGRASEMAGVAAELWEHGRVALDVETTGLSPHRNQARLLQLAVPGKIWIIDLFAVGDTVKVLWPPLQSAEIVVHHAEFDLEFLRYLGFRPTVVTDLLILSRLFTASGNQEKKKKGKRPDENSLKKLAERYLQVTLDKKQQKAKWDGDLSTEMLGYAATDAYVTLAVYESLQADIDRAGLRGVAEEEHRALRTTLWVSANGVVIDQAAWEAQADKFVADLDQAKVRIAALVPPRPMPEDQKDKKTKKAEGLRHWNWNSWKQIIEVFSLLGIRIASSSEEVLKKIDHPLAAAMLAFKEASTQVVRYGRHWLDKLDDQGRMHSTWSSLKAVTGRMSSADVNLQQIPRGERRRCVIAPPGRCLVKCDWATLHLRILATYAPEPLMAQAFHRGDDLHRLTAQKVTGREDVTEEERQAAKIVSFGLIYAMSAATLRVTAKTQYDLDWTMEYATNLRDRILAAYPGIRRWQNRQPKGSRTITVPSGRRCTDVLYLPDKLSYPILMIEADILKASMALAWDRRHEVPGAFPVLVCHDEHVWECYVDQAEAVEAWLADIMLTAAAPHLAPIPVEVESSAGRTWGGAEILGKKKWRRYAPGTGGPDGTVELLRKAPNNRNDHESGGTASGRPQGEDAHFVIPPAEQNGRRESPEAASQGGPRGGGDDRREGGRAAALSDVLHRSCDEQPVSVVPGVPERLPDVGGPRPADGVLPGGSQSPGNGAEGVLCPEKGDRGDVHQVLPEAAEEADGRDVADVSQIVVAESVPPADAAPAAVELADGPDVAGQRPDDQQDAAAADDGAAAADDDAAEDAGDAGAVVDDQQAVADEPAVVTEVEDAPRLAPAPAGEVAEVLPGQAAEAGVRAVRPLADSAVNGLAPTTKLKPYTFPGSALKWFGGKAGNQGKLAKWIVSHFVPHLVYAEAFFGGGTVLLARDPEDRRLWTGPKDREGVCEYVNDIDQSLTTFFRVLASADADELIDRLKHIPFSQIEWEQVRDNLEANPDADPLDIATWLYVLNRQSTDGDMESFAGRKSLRTRRRRAENVSSWQTAVRKNLPAVHERLLRVVVRNMSALDFIRCYDSPDTLHYLDPPYVHRTRTGNDDYDHEMSDADHVELLRTIKTLKGKVLLSGYGNELYDTTLSGWHRVTRATKVQTGSAKKKGDRVEVLWMNYESPTG